jgi:outer membrane receptor protein involved in Fe transport
MDGNTNWAHFYAQDRWQVTGNLKLDIGLRYEYNQNMTDSDNRIAAIDNLTPAGVS